MEEKRRLRIISILWETDDAATFTLEPVDGNTLDYQPGQYLSFIFQTNSGEKRRAYSFSSSPGADALPAVTVKRVVNGEFSNYLLAHAKPGEAMEFFSISNTALLVVALTIESSADSSNMPAALPAKPAGALA